MAEFHLELSLPLPPQRLLQLLTTSHFMYARAHFQRALSVFVEESNRSERSVTFSVRKTEYSRTRSGVDLARVEEVHEWISWDLLEGRSEWSIRYRSRADKVRVEGTNRILSAPHGSCFLSDGVVHVNLPLIGKGIAADIAERIEKNSQKFKIFLQQYIQEQEEASGPLPPS